MIVGQFQAFSWELIKNNHWETKHTPDARKTKKKTLDESHWFRKVGLFPEFLHAVCIDYYYCFNERLGQDLKL